MIFVTVGTHEQPFNRLIKKVDELKRDGIIRKKSSCRPASAPTNQSIASGAS